MTSGEWGGNQLLPTEGGGLILRRTDDEKIPNPECWAEAEICPLTSDL